MRVPVNERVKDAPASALRAMFAGLGSLLGVTDKIRPKHAAPEAAAESAAPAAPEAAAKPEAPADSEVIAEAATPAEPEATAEAAAEAATPAEPEAVAAAEPEPEVVAEPEVAEPKATAGLDAEPTALPIANYDELSVASLRARLRNLSVEQLAELVAYEKGHAAREDVVAMFERRIAKVESEA
jgi:hypothetical protein